jgi:hypothetical protein
MHAQRTTLLVLLTVAVAACAAGSADTATGPALTVGAGPHLLIDDHLLEQGGVRAITPPARRPQPVVTAADRNYQPYVTVRQEGGVFRLWYHAIENDRRYLGHMTSRDGITFARPHRQIAMPAGYSYGASIVKDDRGYLMPFWGRTPGSTDDALTGLSFARSTDGFAWKTVNDKPLQQLGELGIAKAPGDITSLIRWQGRYLLFVKMHGLGYEGVTPNSPFPGYRRIVGVMESRDGISWTEPRPIVTPDAEDEGVMEFYGLGGVVARGGLLVGFLRTLRDDIGEGVGDTVLAWSRDGVTWQRDRQPFLPRGASGSWDAAMAWADAQLVVGDRTLIYYGGYRSGHKTNWETERQIGVATMLRDRYVARAGRVVTKLLRFTRVPRTVNVDGRAAVRVTGATGRLLAVCNATGNAVTVPLRCNRPIPARTPLRLTITIRGAMYGLG